MPRALLPRPLLLRPLLLRRVAWLVAIWAISVAALGIAALAIRLLMGMAGLTPPAHVNDTPAASPRHADEGRHPRLFLV